jgi:glycosyltransferase involved in cell wall biosynthesis
MSSVTYDQTPGNAPAATGLASIIVDNYNYGRFIAEAIDSALGQTYAPIEVIVVDDGSTDDSREVIASYGDRITPVLKENGGQASAFNAGFLASSGQYVLFLDADDALLPRALERAIPLMDTAAAKVHWPMWEIDGMGTRLGSQSPPHELVEGNVQPLVHERGPGGHLGAPTSGNLWSRGFLGRVFPIPEADYVVCPDAYLFVLAALLQEVRRIEEPQGLYRLHGSNNYGKPGFEERIRRGIRLYDSICRSMGDHSPQTVDYWIGKCREHLWYHQIDRAGAELVAALPRGATVGLLDEDEWGTESDLRGLHCVSFPNRDGIYCGRPRDDGEALAQLQGLRDSGVQFLAVAWNAFWWLDYYKRFSAQLSRVSRLIDNERLIVYDLSSCPWPRDHKGT